MINIKRLALRPLTHPSRYRYFTPVEKPIMSLALNSIVQFSAQSMQYCHDEWGMAAQLSVVAGAVGFRIGLQFLGLFFESMNMRNKGTWAHRWINKIFVVDMQRDIVFYELGRQRERQMRWYYTPEKLFSTFLKTYTMFNFLRGGHYLITNPHFAQFCSSPFLALTAYDPTFMLPIPIIIINYLLLSKSKHPFFIHLVRPENRLMCFTVAFMGGLLFAPVYSVYQLSYIGLALGHLLIRSGRYWIGDIKGDIRRIGSWLSKRK